MVKFFGMLANAYDIMPITLINAYTAYHIN